MVAAGPITPQIEHSTLEHFQFRCRALPYGSRLSTEPTALIDIIKVGSAYPIGRNWRAFQAARQQAITRSSVWPERNVSEPE